MKCMLLIYGDEKAERDMPEAAMREMMGAWFAYTEQLREAGLYLAGEGLQPTATARTVWQADGRYHVQDGPFAETKEQLGGFYLLDAPDLAAAIAWAKRCPAVHGGRVEVRPVMTYG